MENVDAILFKQNKPHFDKLIIRLNALGYTSSYKVLNQTGFGIPQNRKRCFMVSTLHKGTFIFPEEQPLQIRLKDFLEPAENVPEEYYLSEKRIKNYVPYKSTRKSDNHQIQPTGYIGKITQHFTVYDPSGLSPTQSTSDCKDPIKIKLTRIGTMTDTNYDITHRVYDTNCQQTCNTNPKQQYKQVVSDDNKLRIRYLTPRECLRLMGQYDDAIDKIMEQCPQKTVQYRLAGNSIVVNVLEAIFKGIYIDNTFKQPEPKQVGLDGWL